MRHLKTLLSVAAVLFFTSLVSAYAENDPHTPAQLFPDSLTLDGKTYKQAALIEAFRNVAFNTTIPSTILPIRDNLAKVRAEISKIEPRTYETDKGSVTFPPPELPWDILFDPALFKPKYPWLYEYLYRDEGVPRYAAVNKWEKPIKISFGFPNDLQPVIPEKAPDTEQTHTVPASRYQQQKAADLYESTVFDARHNDITIHETIAEKIKQAQNVSEQEVTRHVKNLSELTGLDVTYLPHTEETPDNMANVRIVFVDNMKDGCGGNWKTPFKRRVIPDSSLKGTSWRCSPSPVSRFEYTKYILNMRFRADFEQYLSTAVLFTPEAERQVDGYLLPNADNSIGMSFCFITIDHSPEMIKGLVRECLVRSLGLTQAPYDNGTALLGYWNNPDQLITKRARNNIPKEPPEITEMDRFLIKTLYNPQINPGMTVPDLARLLSTHQP